VSAADTARIFESSRTLAPVLPLLLIAIVVTACGIGLNTRRDKPVSAGAAAAFGAVTLPAGAQVLGTDRESDREIQYQLVLRMNARQLVDFLGQCHERPELSEVPKYHTVLAGPPLSGAPNPLYSQDRVSTEDHGTIYRDVTVDERSPDEIHVHLRFSTT
jgi:hypothetical protein